MGRFKRGFVISVLILTMGCPRPDGTDDLVPPSQEEPESKPDLVGDLDRMGEHIEVANIPSTVVTQEGFLVLDDASDVSFHTNWHGNIEVGGALVYYTFDRHTPPQGNSPLKVYHTPLFLPVRDENGRPQIRRDGSDYLLEFQVRSEELDSKLVQSVSGLRPDFTPEQIFIVPVRGFRVEVPGERWKSEIVSGQTLQSSYNASIRLSNVPDSVVSRLDSFGAGTDDELELVFHLYARGRTGTRNSLHVTLKSLLDSEGFRQLVGDGDNNLREFVRRVTREQATSIADEILRNMWVDEIIESREDYVADLMQMIMGVFSDRVVSFSQYNQLLDETRTYTFHGQEFDSNDLRAGEMRTYYMSSVDFNEATERYRLKSAEDIKRKTGLEYGVSLLDLLSVNLGAEFDRSASRDFSRDELRELTENSELEWKWEGNIPLPTGVKVSVLNQAYVDGEFSIGHTRTFHTEVRDSFFPVLRTIGSVETLSELVDSSRFNSHVIQITGGDLHRQATRDFPHLIRGRGQNLDTRGRLLDLVQRPQVVLSGEIVLSDNLHLAASRVEFQDDTKIFVGEYDFAISAIDMRIGENVQFLSGFCGAARPPARSAASPREHRPNQTGSGGSGGRRAASGRNGQDGRNGRTGIHGKSSGNVRLHALTFASGEVGALLCGQGGGVGGAGGAAGNGGNGQRQGDREKGLIFVSKGCGRNGHGGAGGSAGNGGNGGRGGDGGDFRVYVREGVNTSSFEPIVVLDRGQGGEGGAAGSRGEGGDPGSCRSRRTNQCPERCDGIRGAYGARGQSGQPGDNGELGEFYVTQFSELSTFGSFVWR